jgi:hypothetical protein
LEYTRNLGWKLRSGIELAPAAQGIAMKLLIFSASALLLSACVANRTTIQASWADDAYSGPPLGRFAVVALFETRADSLAFERNASDYLTTRGVETLPAHEILTAEQTQTLDEAAVRDRLAATDVDGVLTFRLIAVDERREYQVPTPYLLNVPPDVMSGDAQRWYYEPSSSYYSSYYWYWRSSADVTGSPGYWIEQSFLVAETALFDNRDDRLLWTAKSATMDDAHFQRTSESIVRTVARELLAMDLIAPIAACQNSANGANVDDDSREPSGWTGRGRT